MVKVLELNEINKSSLQGKFIVSSPFIKDERFYKSVVYITSHSPKGASGIVVNKPSNHPFFSIVKNIDKNIKEEDLVANPSIVIGGPVSVNNVFILHSNDYLTNLTVKITKDVFMTNHPNIIMDIIANKGPTKQIVSIGCSNWVEGQLEKELMGDSWIIAEYDFDIMFDCDPYNIWEKIYYSLNLPSNNAFFKPNDVKN